MKRKFVSAAAVCAAFFMAPTPSFADERVAAPLILAKETVPTFTIEDFPWDLPEGRTEDVTVPLGDAVLTMPWMEVETDGENRVLISAPEMTVSADVNGKTMAVLQLDATEFTVRRLGEAMAASGFVEALAISGEQDFRTTAKGVEFSFTSRGYGPVIDAMKANEAADSDRMIEAMSMLNVSLDYSAKSSSFVTAESAQNEIPFDFEMSQGPAEGSISLGDGRIEILAKATKSVFAGAGPIPVSGEIGSLSYRFAMPTDASATIQPISIDFGVSDVLLNDEIWDLADPEKIFPRALERVELGMVMDVVLKRSLFAGSSVRRSPEELEPIGGRLSALEFDGLGVKVSAKGDIEMDGEIPKDVSAYASISGLSGFMKNLVKAGFLPQSQAILGEGIALQFAKEEADGSLTFDVKTEDGMISINDKRVAPLPQ